MAKLIVRINDVTKGTETLVLSARRDKETAVRRELAHKQTKTLDGKFSKYDADKDKILSYKEVIAYAKAEFKISLSEDDLARIWKCAVVEGEKGVSIDNLNLLNSSIGIARELQRNRKRKEAREAKEKLIAGLKSKLNAKIQTAETAIMESEKEVVTAEKALPSLLAREREVPKADLEKQLQNCEKLVKAASASMVTMHKKVEAILDGFDETYKDVLKEYTAPQERDLEKRIGRFELRLGRCTNLCARFRTEALRKEATALHNARRFAFKQASQYAQKNELSVDELFSKTVDTNGDGHVDEKEFLQFFAAAAKEVEVTEEGEDSKKVELTPELLKTVFKSLLEKGSTKFSKDAFVQRMHRYYKVVQETPMTSELAITGNGAASIRQLKAGEVVLVLEGPKKEDTTAVMRIRARAMEGDKEGWVTLAGNQGAVYLQEGGDRFKVLRDSVLTGSFEASEKELGEIDGPKKVKEREVVEVLEWPKKHETSGLTRMKVQVILDGRTGWLTQSDKDGVKFADVL
eukprot:TRINITY_DN66403_c0_g1_i1.p1 TRINITY_DN66403_c0_g1~~TRINITY_DN66403_c0_g1_i1.p1  ORF type:complete len:582 (-),score=165.56 TRINITY_DN66403_c0_g1_i1:74-1630(-)